MEGKKSADSLIQGRNEEEEKVVRSSMRTMQSFFFDRTDKVKYLENTGSPLYDAMVILVNYLKMKIVEYDKLKELYGDSFGPDEVAELSHIPGRSVFLEDEWRKEEMGNLLVFDEETGTPYAMIHTSTGYKLYGNGMYGKRVTKKVAGGISRNAFMLYKTFPKSVMKKKDVMLFCLRSVVGKTVLLAYPFFFLITVFAGLVIPYYCQSIYDTFIPRRQISSIYMFGLMIIFAIVAKFIYDASSKVILEKTGNALSYNLSAAIYDKIFRLPSEVYNGKDSSELSIIAFEVSDALRDSTIETIRSFFGVIIVGTYFAVLLNINVKITLLSTVLLILTFVVVIILNRGQYRVETILLRRMAIAHTFIYNALQGIQKIKLAGARKWVLNEYIKRYSRVIKPLSTSRFIHCLIDHLITMVPILVVSIIIFYEKRVNDSMTPGMYISYMGIFGLFSNAMFSIINAYIKIKKKEPAYDRAKVILENEVEDAVPGKVISELEGAIEVNHLSYTYPEMKKPTVNDISFSIKAGEYIGIVGASGCGKSTLLNILLGFITQNSGKIYYDKNDMDALDKKALRKKMGVVLQNGKLISGSIAENIAVTNPHATLDEIMEALDIVGLTEDIEKMPMGVHTMLSESSITISGGQRQRILIARAILGKPSILFMDEATSALDEVTQKMVVESLNKIGATRIVIAHRLSTIKNCDRIFVLEKGKITQMGNFTELLNQEGFFKKLATRQLV